MNTKQIWQTIALDLKRAANYMYLGYPDKADYYLSEAKNLYDGQTAEGSLKKIEKYIKFDGNPEEILLSGSLISTRI